MPIDPTTQPKPPAAEGTAAELSIAGTEPAEPQTDVPMIMPFLSLSWGKFGGKYCQQMVRVPCDWANMGRYAAQQLKGLPKGKRAICFQNAEVGGKLFWHPADMLAGNRRSLWWPNGIAATATHFGSVIDLIFANGADVEFAVFDIESGMSNWTLDEPAKASIYADPRYKDLVATGNFPADCRNMNQAEYTLFNFGCANLFDRAVKSALIAPLYKRYPNISWCNFADAPVTKADAALAPDFNGVVQPHPPSSATHYSPSLYANVGSLGNDARFKTPFYALAWSCNTVRAIYRAKAGAKVIPWVAPRVLSNALDAAHWQELLFHACCLSGTNFLYFNHDDETPLANWRFDNAISQYVANARGKTWKQTLTTDLTRYDNATYVLSAAKLADGSVVGRVTFKPGINSATFTVDGKKYTTARAGNAVGAWFHS